MRSLTHLFSRRRRYDDLEISMREHLAEKIEELTSEGMPRVDAERVARREFGNMTLIAERSREVWQWPTIESLWADVRFAVRQLVKAPGFTATAVVTLALGIAVNATMFSLVSAFLMPRVPGTNARSLVVVSSVDPGASFLPDTTPVSAPNYLAWRGDTRVFAEMAAADEYRTANLTGQGEPESLNCAAVSPNYFHVFGVAPELGRLFLEGEDQPGRNHVVILSHGLWARRYGSDPGIIGRTVRMDRTSYEVAGVMPEDFKLMGFMPQMWTPLVLTAEDQSPAGRKQRNLFVIARLARGVTLEQARAEMTILGKRAEADFPAIEKRWGVAVRGLSDFLVHSFGIRPALAILMTAVSFVLLIACANVAGLLLVRSAGRQKELAIRVSLGAGRLRVLRQLLTEGFVLSVLGGSAGLLLTYLGIGVLRANLNFNEAISAVPVGLDTPVLLFLLGVSVVSAMVSSLAPAWKASRADTNASLKSESRTSSAGRSQGRMRAVLVCFEIAFAFCLLTGTCLLIHGVFLLDHQELGFRTDHVLTAGVTLDQARYGDGAHQLAFARSLLRSLKQIAGVEDVALASDLPATNPQTVPIRIEGESNAAGNESRNALDAVVSPEYFAATGLAPLRGRTFTEMDDEKGRRVVLVNQEFAQRYFAGRDALGKRVQLEIKGSAPAWGEIVGVIRNVKSFSEDTRVDPEIYEAFAQRPVAAFSMLVRSSGEPAALSSAVRHAVAQLDADLPVTRVMTLRRVIEQQQNGNPLFIRLLSTFAILALILAATGIYGLIAYSVSQRTHEIAIRVALGAKKTDISRMIFREGLAMAAIGSGVGLLMALPLPKVFDAMFAGLQFVAPELYAAVLVAVAIVAAFAIYVPARRATLVDANTALRDQ